LKTKFDEDENCPGDKSRKTEEPATAYRQTIEETFQSPEVVEALNEQLTKLQTNVPTEGI
jgi:hypothetical protein